MGSREIELQMIGYSPMLHSYLYFVLPLHRTTFSCSDTDLYCNGTYEAAEVTSLATDATAVLFQDPALPMHKTASVFQLLLVAVK